MELEIRPHDPEDRAYRISVILLAILMALVVALQLWSAWGHRSTNGSDSGNRAQGLTSGDIYAKCWIAWPEKTFANYTLVMYERARPWPSAYRRIGVLKQSLGEQGLTDLRKIDLPGTLRGLDLSKKQIAKLHNEKKMWLRVYGPDKLTAAEARQYAADIRKLNLGPLKSSAVAFVYRKAGMSGMAERVTRSAQTENQKALVVVGVLMFVLTLGGLGGLAIAIYFLATVVPRFCSAPLTHIRPSVLITSFIIYLASYIAIGGAADLIGETVGIDFRGASSGTLFMGLTIVAAALAYTFGLSALVSRLRPSESWREIGYRTVSAGRDVLWGAAGYLSALPFVTVAAIISAILTKTLFRHFPTPQQPFGEMVSKGGALEVAFVFIGASIVAPIVEETFFRGVLYSAFRGRMGVWPAITLTAALFAMIHPLPGGFIPIFALACVLALLRERSGSLLPGIVCHGVYNTTVLIFAGLLLQ